MSETTMDRDLNLSNFRIKNVGTAVDPDDAVSKAYLETTRPSMFDTIETIEDYSFSSIDGINELRFTKSKLLSVKV